MSASESANRQGDRDDGRVLKSRMRVTARQDGWIQLQGERGASCSSCAAKSGCGIKGLSDFMGQPPQICAPASVAAAEGPAVGDEVVVSISGNEFLKLAMLAYLLPPAALVATACLSAVAGLGDTEGAILALIAFAISFLPLRRCERSGSALTTFAIEETRQTYGEGGIAAWPQTDASPSQSPQNGNRT